AEAEEMVINASDMLRDELPYIGWDVIITEDGPRIIEGNPWPGIQLIQVHYPLFNNVRFREFMEFHGVKGL
ncbi:MAG: sugar-transfer associated ATP-grasp domain-containing protein, partial [bacterium]